MSRLPRTAPALPPRVRRLILALVAFTTITGVAGTALSPYLLVEHPLVLLGLNPISRHLVLVANRVELWEALIVGSARRTLNFLATYGVGALYGHALITFFEKRGRWAKKIVNTLEAVYARLGILLVILAPFYSVAALAGIARLRFRLFVIAILPGQVAFAFVWLYFGNAVETWTDPIIDWLAKHVAEATAVAIALVVAQQLYARYRKRRKDQSEPDLPL